LADMYRGTASPSAVIRVERASRAVRCEYPETKETWQ
jgi:hypothetical protein